MDKVFGFGKHLKEQPPSGRLTPVPQSALGGRKHQHTGLGNRAPGTQGMKDQNGVSLSLSLFLN